MTSLPQLISRLVAFSCRHARAVVGLCFAASVACAAYAGANFSIHTEIGALVPEEVAWRVNERALEGAFVQQADEIVVVVDGRTPELAEAAAARLTTALAKREDLFRRVERPGGGPFFARQALLYLSLDEVRHATSELIQAQPLLGPVAADPSLRGVLTSLDTAAQASAAGAARPEALAPALSALADASEAAEHGGVRYVSWRPLITGGPASPDDARQFIALTPKLDYRRSDPAKDAFDAARAAAADLRLDPQHGVRLRFTGEVAMESDELATLEEATGYIALASLLLAVGVLFMAVRSARMVTAILATVACGAALTTAFGLAIYGRFNLISVAFLPLFAGLGVDFAIQVCVRYRAEAMDEAKPAAALAAAGGHVGRGLILAGAALSLGFLAFLPTRYTAVSQLGAIAGFGLVVALVLALSFLPALLTLMRAGRAAAEAGFPRLRQADAWLQSRRTLVLGVAIVALLIAAAAIPRLRFNFDPLALRDPRTESVASFLEMARDPETSPDALDVLAADLPAARAQAARLARLPQVRQVITADAFVPADQPAKLAVIADAALLLGPTIDPFDLAARPSDADLVAALSRTAATLDAMAATPAAGPVRADARRLSTSLHRLAVGPASARARLQAAAVAGLPVALDQVRAMLQAQPVSLETLPAEIKDDWIAADGRARVEVLPAVGHFDSAGLDAFAAAVAREAPGATGGPIAIEETRRLALSAFSVAALLSLAGVTVLLLAALRSLRAVLLTLTTVAACAVLTLGTWVVLGGEINPENMIALPLLLGIGVSFNIYFVVAWRQGERRLLASSLTRAISFSALTTAAAFGALCLSKHPGTASMGWLLLVSLGWTAATTLLLLPTLLGLGWGGGRRADAHKA